jgi:hypothetical protein
MKKTIGLFFALGAVIFIASCSSNKEKEIVAPQGMMVLDLGKYGKPFAIFVPDTTNAKLQITQQSYGALDIKVGNGFAISINEQMADIELKKKDLKEDEVNKLKNMVTDEPTAILWESEIMQPEFHFLINKKIGTADYSFEDIKSTESNPFGKDAIQKMFDSCKSVEETKQH